MLLQQVHAHCGLHCTYGMQHMILPSQGIHISSKYVVLALFCSCRLLLLSVVQRSIGSNSCSHLRFFVGLSSMRFDAGMGYSAAQSGFTSSPAGKSDSCCSYTTMWWQQKDVYRISCLCMPHAGSMAGSCAQREPARTWPVHKRPTIVT